MVDENVEMLSERIKDEIKDEILMSAKEVEKDYISKEMSPEEIAMDKKYTDIQVVGNIVWSILKFDAEKHDKLVNYIFDDGIVWKYTDTEGYISKDYLFNLTLRMSDITKPLELFVSHVHQLGVTNVACWSVGDNINAVHTIDDSDEERYEIAEKFLCCGRTILGRIRGQIKG